MANTRAGAQVVHSNLVELCVTLPDNRKRGDAAIAIAPLKSLTYLWDQDLLCAWPWLPFGLSGWLLQVLRHLSGDAAATAADIPFFCFETFIGVPTHPFFYLRPV